MGYAKHIGRVGALAVALGVGAAVANAPAVALADATDSSSSSADSANDANGASTTGAAGDGDSSNDTTPGSGPSGPVTPSATATSGATTSATDDTSTATSTAVPDGISVLRRPADTLQRSLSALQVVVRDLAKPLTDSVNSSVGATSSGAGGGAAGSGGTAARSSSNAPAASTASDNDAPKSSPGTVSAAAPSAAAPVQQPAVTRLAAPLGADNSVSAVPASALSANAVTAAADPAPAPAADPVTSVVTNLLAGIFGGGSGGGDPATGLGFMSLLTGFFGRNAFSNSKPVVNDKTISLVPTGPGFNSGPISFGGTDADGDPLVYSVPAKGQPTGPQKGTVTVDQATGAFVYTPDPAFIRAGGQDTFTVTVSDQSGGAHFHGFEGLLGGSGGHTDTAVITVNVTGTNTAAPVANNDTYGAAPSKPLIVTAANGVLKNDTDADNDPLTAALVTGPTKGSLSFQQDGSFVYTANPGVTGTDTFTYRASDGDKTSNLATVTIVTNNPPVAVNDSYTTSPGTTLTVGSGTGVLANDTDVESNPLTAAVVTNPTKGTLALNPNGSFTYTPTTGFVGTDTFTYRASDATGQSAPATVTIVVDTPLAANNDSYTVAHGKVLDIPAPGVKANDGGISSGPVTVELLTTTQNGTLRLGPDGSINYAPTSTFTGTDSFTYRLKRGDTVSAPATVVISVTNATPVAVADAYTVNEDQTLSRGGDGVLANDTDADGDILRAQLVSGPSNGQLNLNQGGSFTYTPNAGFNGSDSFTYSASDGVSQSAPVTVTITVVSQPDAPVAANDAYTTVKGKTLTVPVATGVLTNDTDQDGGALVVGSVVNQPQNGTLSLNNNGSFTYVPNASFTGTDTFTYTTKDLQGNISNPGTVTITVVDAPTTAINDSYTTGRNVPLNVGASGVLANDIDADNQALTATLGTNPANGTLTLNPNGSFTYTPTTGFVGTDSFTYTATDGTNVSSPATVTITVTNATPVANPNSYSTNQNTPLTVGGNGVLGNDTDPNGDPLTASVFTQPTHGTLVLDTDGSFTYTPTTGYAGTDSFSYRAGDGASFSAPATVTITVTAVNAAPVAVNDSYSTTPGTTLTVGGAGVLANDVDTNGDTMTAAVSTAPAHGILTLNPNGSFTYTPTAGYVGTDTFTYTASDGVAQSTPATVTVVVAAAPTGAVDDSYTTGKGKELRVTGPGVLANDGVTGTAVLVQGPPGAAGSFRLDPDGGFIYSPTATFTGTTTFTYRVRQADGTLSNTAVASITVANSTPVAVPDSYSVNEDQVLNQGGRGVLTNDTDADGDVLRAVLVSGPTNGTLSLAQGGTFVYTPKKDFHGTDTFTYQATDGTSSSAVTLVTITVNAVADTPTAVNDNYSTAKNTPLTRDAAQGVLANDSDGDGDALTAAVVNGPSHGTLSLNADGSFTYTPATGYVGNDSFTYSATGAGQSSNATVNISISDLPPVANNDSYSTANGTALTVAAAQGVLVNDSDPAGEPITAVLVGNPPNGTVVLNPDGSFVYNPNPGFTGADSFTYRASDGTSLSSQATVTVNVGPPVIPKAVNDNYTARTDTPLVVTAAQGVLANDTDPNGDALSASIVEGPTRGTLTLLSSGAFVYTPEDGYAGPDSFTYRASDGTNSAEGVVSLTVVAPASPVAVPDVYVVNEDNTLSRTAAQGVLINDIDAENQPLTAVKFSDPEHGTLVFNTDGSFTYTPDANWFGTDTFKYRVTDGTTLSTTADVRIIVQPVNDVPVATDANLVTLRNTPLNGDVMNYVSDVDNPNSTLTAAVAVNPAHGTVNMNPDGTFSYTPNTGYAGNDSFVYRVTDPGGLSALATVNVLVNTPPTAVNDTYPSPGMSTMTVAAPGVLPNDTAGDAGQTLTAHLVSQPSVGVVNLSPNGGFTYTGSNGSSVSFQYRVFDGYHYSSPATVFIGPVV